MTSPRIPTPDGHPLADRDQTSVQAPQASAASTSALALRQGAEPYPPPSVKVTRTSGSDGRFCQECGAVVTGRRRNGFCSDRCRVQARRQERDARIDTLLTTAEACLSTLRKELGRGRTKDVHD